ncbi:3-oxoacid CoA-transferase A subunit [Peribacillus deserti]|uniref:3-oxoacid CoA-transferase A subunit n=1 Tax=Peribacillus deserti TaxID=673318 RepID=A0ABS2QDE3_9BACI|nr:CoA transferase subunit A [Peribacillus deserti]MBM7691187.1 3-oxoacid CoA-transferase A subunit [Peribacillus deserti]
MKKLITPQEAVTYIKDGCRVMVGGFGLVGCPLTLVDALLDTAVKDLEIISNNLGEPGKGLGALVRQQRVRKGIGSYFTSNPEVAASYHRGELEVELLPQGTLSEAIRAGGAGIAAFYTPVGAGTEIAAGKEERVFSNQKFILQEALKADVALIKACQADELGNLIYTKSARNFNPIMATAAKIVIAEIDEMVPIGELSPEHIVTPHLFVDFLVLKEAGRT